MPAARARAAVAAVRTGPSVSSVPVGRSCRRAMAASDCRTRVGRVPRGRSRGAEPRREPTMGATSDRAPGARLRSRARRRLGRCDRLQGTRHHCGRPPCSPRRSLRLERRAIAELTLRTESHRCSPPATAQARRRDRHPRAVGWRGSGVSPRSRSAFRARATTADHATWAAPVPAAPARARTRPGRPSLIRPGTESSLPADGDIRMVRCHVLSGCRRATATLAPVGAADALGRRAECTSDDACSFRRAGVRLVLVSVLERLLGTLRLMTESAFFHERVGTSEFTGPPARRRHHQKKYRRRPLLRELERPVLRRHRERRSSA